jgi:hypothetical protein
MDAFRRSVASLFAIVIVLATAVLPYAARQPGVEWLILVDYLHLQFTSTGYLRQLVTAIGTDLVQEGDAFTVAVTLGHSAGIDRTTDRLRMKLFAKDLSGAGLWPKDVIRLVGMSREVELREDMMLAAFSTMLDTVREPQGRRRALVVISNGWPSGPEGHTVQVMTSLAKAQVIPVITIDPEQFVRVKQPIARVDPDVTALMATTRASLRQLAERTGGLALLESRDVAEVIRRARSGVTR